MKKTLVLLSALALVAGGAFAADTYTGSFVDKYTSGVVQKEANLRKNIADKQKAQENKAVQCILMSILRLAVSLRLLAESCRKLGFFLSEVG